MTITESLVVLLVAVQFGTILIVTAALSAMWQRIQELQDWDDDEDEDDDDGGDWWKKANARGNN